MIDRYSVKEISTIFSDETKFSHFLEIEILLIEALEKIKVVPTGVADRIRKKAKFSVNKINEIEKKTHHDVVSFVLNVSESIGKDAQYIHWGITSSDLLDTTLSWQIKDSLAILYDELKKLLKAARKQALKYKDTVSIGRSHGVHAEPYSFGLKFALLYDEINRAYKHLKSIEPEVCRGKISGAVGTFAHFPPSVEKYICNKLKLTPAPISTQIVSRDGYAYLLTALSVLASVYERFAVEVRHLHRTEVKEAEEPFAKGQKGSSAMPHKKNPIICERIAGFSRLLRGYAVTAMENIALWHERDISHSSTERVIIPDAFHIIVYATRKMINIVENIVVYPENMLRNLELSGGIIYSQKLLLALMMNGMKRPDAYDLVQKIAFDSVSEKKTFIDTASNNEIVNKYISRKELEKIFKPENYIKNVDKIYKKVGIL